MRLSRTEIVLLAVLGVVVLVGLARVLPDSSSRNGLVSTKGTLGEKQPETHAEKDASPRGSQDTDRPNGDNLDLQDANRSQGAESSEKPASSSVSPLAGSQPKKARNIELPAGRISADEALASLCDQLGLELFRSGNANLKAEVQVDDPTPSAILDAVARAARVPLAGNLDDLDQGYRHQIHFTPLALYVGDNRDVVKALEQLSQGSPESRTDAIKDLGDIAFEQGENLESVLSHNLQTDFNEEVRAEAAVALEHAQSGESIDALVAALSDSSVLVREHARTTLGLVGTDEVLQKLKQAYPSIEDNEIRKIFDQILEERFDQPIRIEGL
ncbi:MAG TPA: HEAT repeat domain-containing protein [bacterium]|nr:HEAT repeat domain-containing protein [bacterium]